MITKITHRDIRGFTCDFHRNGVTGAGFHICRFFYLTDDGDPASDIENMRAIVFDLSGYVAVTSEDNPEQHWRGDLFEDVLRDSIQIVNAKKKATS